MLIYGTWHLGYRLQFTHEITTKEYHYIVGWTGYNERYGDKMMKKNGEDALEQKQLLVWCRYQGKEWPYLVFGQSMQQLTDFPLSQEWPREKS
jgi:hypothetical protein